MTDENYHVAPPPWNPFSSHVPAEKCKKKKNGDMCDDASVILKIGKFQSTEMFAISSPCAFDRSARIPTSEMTKLQ